MLWIYHPGMNKVMALVIMECQNENTLMIKHFLQICECYTRGAYEWISGALQDICDQNNILHWLEW